MSVSEYDTHIDELLHAYHDELLRQGVEGYTFKKFMTGYRDAAFFTFLKSLVVIGTIDWDSEGGQVQKDRFMARMDDFARWSDAEGFCRRLPILFMIMNIINFFRRD